MESGTKDRKTQDLKEYLRYLLIRCAIVQGKGTVKRQQARNQVFKSIVRRKNAEKFLKTKNIETSQEKNSRFVVYDNK